METPQILGGRYELRRRIGVGGMAAVFLAHDVLLDRDIAVKVLDMTGVTDDTFVERFRREARAAAAINHPNVISIYDWGQIRDPADGSTFIYYLVMEYVPGPNLKEKIQREGPVPEDEALRIAAEIASALEAAYARSLIHRDIKSQNVLIDSSGHAKVADFGIAYLEGLSHLTQTNAVSGSAHYISPEQAQGKRVDARTDIYSLGVVLYELLTGHVPFEGESLIDVALHHVQDQPVPISRLQPGISAATEAIVATALAKDPAQRFSTATDLRAALERARAEYEARAARTEPHPPPAVVVDRVPRSAARTPASVAPEAPGHTVKLGAGVPGRRPRVRQPERRTRWWLWAVPVLLLALVGGALAMRSLSPGPTTAAHTNNPSGGGKTSAGSTRRAAAPAATATHPAATATAVPQPTAPAPTRTPAATPTSPPTPTVVTPRARPNPTSSGNSALVASGASSPDGAVMSFYRLVTQHRYAAAAALWSNGMKANYPPATNISGRFDHTQRMNLRITNVTQQGDTATVGVALSEQKTDGTVNGLTGSWNLVRGPSGWLLDSVTLNPAQVSSGAGVEQNPPDHGKHKANQGDQSNG